MSALRRELVFLILQFLDEENFKETIHKLEEESGFFFNMNYFEDQVTNGKWEEVERYLSSFTKWDDNCYSLKMFFEIRKQKYLEALDKKDLSKAVNILMKDLKVFASFNEELFQEITQLLTLDDFRENNQLSKYGDEKSARAIMLVELKKLIEINPLICDKLQFPYIRSSRLRTLINQSLNWQHQLCKNPRPNPDIKTLFVDHSCSQPNGARAPSPAKKSLLGGPLLKPQFQPSSVPVQAPIATLMSNTPSGDHPADSSEPLGLSPASIPAARKHPRTPPTNPFVDFPSGDSDHVNAGSATASSIAGLADRVASVVNISVTNGDVRNLGDTKLSIASETNVKSTFWKLTEINDPSQCRSLKLPEDSKVTKISRLIYTNSGNAILALASNSIHLLWKWQRSHLNSSGKATADASPQLWQPSMGILMVNGMNTNLEEAVPCFALSKNDSYVISASGGKISLFNMLTFRVLTTFMPPLPSATFIALHPQDNNIIAVGMDDSTIQIYNIRVDEVQSRLNGHSKRITGLAFSQALNVLVSSGADAQICVWGSDKWEKQKSINLQVPSAKSLAAGSEIHVQFHKDQIDFLVVQETLLAIYEATKLECMNQWNPPQSSAPMSHATFSCDGQLVYTTFLDATVCIFNAADLRLHCRINPSAYISSNISNSSVQPLVIAAHPEESNQFAIGMSDGSVHVFEPLESEDKWGGTVENTTTLVGASASDHQAQKMIAKAMAGCKINP